MDKKNKNPNVPNLRFSSFTNSYCVYTLGEILQRVSNPVNIDENKLYYQIGIRSHSKGIFYKKAEIGKQIGNKKIFWVESNCLILNIVFAWEQAVAKTSQKEIGMVVSHRFPMYKVLNNSLDYIVDFFKTEKGRQVLQMASPGGAGRNKTLNQKFFLNSKVYLPSLKEQLIISRFIALIENRIETQIKIIEDLVLQKKYIISSLLTPFQDKKKILLKDILFDYNVKTTSNNEYPVLSSTASGIYLQSEYFNNKEASSDNTAGYKIIPRGYCTYRSMSDTGLFTFNIQNLVERGIVSPAYPVFSSNEYINEFIILYLNNSTDIKKQILELKSGGTRFALSFSTLCTLKIPKLEKEKQLSLVKTVTAFERKIENEEIILNKLHQQKKYLLNNMFI